MKTFGNLTKNDKIYKVNLTFNQVETLNIVNATTNEEIPNRVIISFDSEYGVDELHFGCDSYISTTYNKDTIWTSEKEVKELIMHAFKEGMNYQKKQIRKTLGI